ncbi:MAG TPA: hypothetical protein VIO38_13590 [Rariglobus sp.]
MTKKSVILLGLIALLLGGAAALWHTRATSERSRERERVVSGIVTTPHDSHRPQSSLATDGTERSLPSNPALAEALSHTSRLDYALRLKAVHALQGSALPPDQAAFLRAFVAAPGIPTDLTIRQVRALKNDVLNVLCVQAGEEAATAEMLRALYADETQDAGLRDYALQHLVTLIDRNPAIGWDTHWTAVESDNPALAATAMLHLAAQLRAQSASANLQPFSPSALQSLSSAALRLAADTTAKDPARTTALQVCGQLKLTAARPLAGEIARSDQAGLPLRIAAVATLGDLGGDETTRAYLTTLTTGPEKRLRIPAQSALKRFSIN